MRGMKVRDARGALLLALAPLACTSQVLPNSTTTSLGPGGGTAHSTDGLFSLIVPPNALTGPVDVVIETDTTGPLPGQLGAAYRVLPADLRFAEPATARRRLDARWVGGALARLEHPRAPAGRGLRRRRPAPRRAAAQRGLRATPLRRRSGVQLRGELRGRTLHLGLRQRLRVRATGRLRRRAPACAPTRSRSVGTSCARRAPT
jgi:hypothetical protein